MTEHSGDHDLPPKILLLEDNRNDSEFVRARVLEEGFSCSIHLAQRRAEYEAAIRDGGWDLILSDYALPDYDGLSALRLKNELLPDVPFIFLSGSFGEELAVESLKEGAVDYILKSRSGRLVSSIRRALEEVRIRRNHKEILEALQLSEARYRTFVGATSKLAWVANRDGTEVEDISGWCEFTGHSQAELSEYGWLVAVHPDDRQSTLKTWKEAVERKSLYDVEYRLRNADGNYRLFNVRAVPIFHPDGTLREWMGTCSDLTEQRKRVVEIGQAVAIVESSLDAIISIDANRLVTTWNPAAERVFGYTSEEMIGKSLARLAPEDLHREQAEVFTRVERGESVRHYTTVRNHRNGDQIPVAESISPIKDPQGKIIGIAKIIRDVTEQRIAEDALRESEERFRQLAENINEVFWMTDPTKQQMLYVSPGYERIWGRTVQSLHLHPEDWIESIHEEDRSRVQRAASTKQVDGTYDESYRIVRPDGSLRWVRDRAYPVRSASGEVFRIVGTAQDITEQRRLEEQLRESQKLEAIGTLAGGVAHDFNNILGSINGFAELARSSISDPNRLSEYLEEVLRAGWRASALVKQILTFSRQGPAPHQAIQLEEIVEEALNLLRATIPREITVVRRFSPALPKILADSNQIHQLVMNLCVNALYAMKDVGSGTLELSIEEVRVDEPLAKLHPQLDLKSYLCLSVRDTGRGMELGTVERIFEPFFTTKAPGEGTGLGLSVVHGIMKSHGGVISVSSERDEGTLFQLYFPQTEEILCPQSSGERETPRGSGERILFVDDEEPLVKIAVEMLERLQYRVDGERDPMRALERIRENPGRYQLIILDLTMAEMSGEELAAAISVLEPELPKILTTGNPKGITEKRLRSLGIREVLLKPFSHCALGEVVYRILDKKGRSV